MISGKSARPGDRIGPSALRSFSLLRAAAELTGSIPFWWCICVCCAAILAWAGRHSMNPDGLSYLDLASEAQTGGPLKLVNGYWSPGYPALIGITFLLIHPSPAMEFPLLHLVNLIIFIFALWGFSTFWKYCYSSIAGNEAANEGRRRYIMPFAFCTFLWFTLTFIGTEVVTPDLEVAGIVFFVAALNCRLSLDQTRWRHYAALGFVLGVGYYVKAAMFPLGLVLLLLLFFVLPLSEGMSRKKLFLSLCLSFSVFLLVSAPLIGALSFRAKALSFGEAGRLNYAWYVNGHRWANDVEHPQPFETTDHPAPKLLTKPVTLEFASRVEGTYPLWYDPSYWYAGLKVRFDLRQQITTLRRTLSAYKGLVLDSFVFFSGTIVLGFFALQRNSNLTVLRRSCWQLGWPLAACSMFAFVHVESRFVGAFFVVSFVAVYVALMSLVDNWVAVAVSATVLCTAMVPFSADVATKGVRMARDVLVQTSEPEYEIAALGLRNLGLKNGDRLAIVGNAYQCYYARYDRLRIVAQIPNTSEFWDLTRTELSTLTKSLRSIGVNAIVAWNRPHGASPIADWKDLKVSDSLRLSVLVLSP